MRAASLFSLVISVLSIRTATRFMFRAVFSFLLCSAVFFRLFRHRQSPFITIFAFKRPFYERE